MTMLLLCLTTLLADETTGALDVRALDNLTAFTRLLGYVQYFHPSDEAAATDWNTFAVEGIKRVEKAAGPAELIATLSDLFRPIAPTVRVFAEGETPPRMEFSAIPKGDDAEIIAWVHQGLGTGNDKSIYHSERVRAPWAGKRPASFPDVAQPWRATLIAGVACEVPLALFTQQGHTVPAGTARPEAKRDPGSFSASDRATRLAIVALAWNVFQHFYPYFDVVSTDWPAVLQRSLRAAATDRDERAFLVTLRHLVAALHDGHGNVFHRSEPPSWRPRFTWDWIDNQLVVTHVDIASGPAPSRGDAVLAIDGKPVAQALAEAEALVSSATAGWTRWVALNTYLGAGANDQPLTLALQKIGGAQVTVTCQRTPPTQGFGEPRPEAIEEIEPGIMYVDLDRVTSAQFTEALPDLEQAKGLIFDMRGYPSKLDSNTLFSHLSDRPLTSAQWHIPHVTRPDRDQMQFERGGEWDLQPKAPLLKAKKVFITDGRAISYAESCMGIVEHYRLGEIVGAPTAGTNGNVNPIALPGNYMMVWTGMKVLKHDGSQHHGIGILPTVPAQRTRRAVAEGVDELLERAIDVVSS